MNERDIFENHELDFLTEEEKADMCDGAILGLGELINAEQEGTHVTDFERVREMLAAYRMIKSLSKSKGVKVAVELNQPYVSMGNISIVGKDVVFYDSEDFIRAARLANNLDIYPKTNGTVRVTLTFHGLTKKAGV